MFLNYCYYFLSSSLIASACFGTYYHFNKKGATALVLNVSWRGLNIYVKTKDYLERFFDHAVEKDSAEKEEEEEVSKRKFIFIGGKYASLVVDKITETLEAELDDQMNIKLQFVWEDPDKYRRISDKLTTSFDKEGVEFIKVEKPFIQVELKQQGETIEIHKFLKEHYFSSNKILDKDFLEWFLPFYGFKELGEEYELKIIDHNVEMFTLHSNQYILLTKEGYQCMKEGEGEDEEEEDEVNENNETSEEHPCQD